MKQLLPFLIVYFIWDFVSTLLKVEGPFQAVHWIMLAMTVVFAVLLVLTTKQAIEDYNRQKAARAEEEEKERQKQAARRRTMYVEDFEDTRPSVESEPDEDSPETDSPSDSDGETAAEYAEYEGRRSDRAAR